MSITSDFQKQWKGFAAIVESELIRMLNEGNVTCERVNVVIKRELSRWSNSSQVQGIWLNRLLQRNAAVGSKFKDTILNIKIEDIPNVEMPSVLTYAAGTLITGLAGFCITKILNMVLWKVIGFTIIPMFIFGSVLAVYYNEAQKKTRDKIVLLYMKQLNQYRDKLEELCIKAESM